MDLQGTQTEKNLLLAYTGESLNRNLYTFFANQAEKEGYEQIAAIFRETADHEQEHAKQELNFLQTSDIELPTGIYPIKGVGNSIANLETAVAGEHYEQTTMYPEFAKTAAQEDFPAIARMLRHIEKVEAFHEKRFSALLQNIKGGRAFKRDRAVQWKCRACGYVKEGKEAPQSCPICGLSRAYFEILAENW
jgi:rubrerythrin